MSLTNPTKLINLQELSYFEGKLALKYQGKAISISGITAETVEGALAELASAISAIPSAIVPKGTRTFSQLAPSTDLAAANVGFMWNISDAFTTTSDFVEGAGKSIPAGANVYVANPESGVYKYDVFQGMVDLSGYALKSEMAVEDGTGANADKTTITLKSGTSATVLKSHQDISGKADKVSSATNGNFAGLDGNGNLTDSGSKATDFATAAQGEKADSAVQSVAEGATDGTIAVDGTDVAVHGLGSAAYEDASAFQAAGNYKTTQSAVSDPTAGSATDTLNFIATISQNANGEISATKQPVRSASASQSGLMSSAHYSKLDAIAYAADSDIDEIFA